MNDNKDTYKNKNEFFKTIINQFMVNKMEDLSYDKMMIERRIDFHQFDIDTYYDIYSQASEGDPLDTYGSVFDSTGELYADDDSGEYNNFLMSGVLLEEGVTYYIGARLYTGEGTVNYNIVIQLVS